MESSQVKVHDGLVTLELGRPSSLPGTAQLELILVGEPTVSRLLTSGRLHRNVWREKKEAAGDYQLLNHQFNTSPIVRTGYLGNAWRSPQQELFGMRGVRL